MRGIKTSLLRRDVLPFYLSLLLLTLVALGFDALLHALDAAWIGRYLGIVGSVLILASFGYSLRKRKLIEAGRPAQWLLLHQRMAWTGSMLVLVHAGIHINSILAWLAVWAMLVNVASGLTGKYLLDRARIRLETNRQQLSEQGLSSSQVEERLYWDACAFDLMRKWRVIHVPITLAFAILALAHIVSTFLFWAWR